MWGGTWIMRLINHLWPGRDKPREQHGPSPVLLFNISSINHQTASVWLRPTPLRLGRLVVTCSQLHYNWLSLSHSNKISRNVNKQDWPPSTIYHYHLPPSPPAPPVIFPIKTSPVWPGLAMTACLASQSVLYVLQGWEPSLGLLQNVKMFLLERTDCQMSDTLTDSARQARHGLPVSSEIKVYLVQNCLYCHDPWSLSGVSGPK